MIEELNAVQTAGALTLLGICTAGATLVLFPLSSLVVSALAWVDDKKYEGRNPMTLLLARLQGYKPVPGCNYYFTNGKKKKFTADLVGTVLVLLAAFFPLSYLAIKFYEVPMALGLLYAIAHTARFARRHKKLFDEHVKDPEAHK